MVRWPAEVLLELIGDLYEAALEPQSWPYVLERLAIMLQTEATVLMAHDTGASRLSLTCGVRIDDAFQSEYNEYYSTKNIWAIRGKDYIRSGAVFTGDMVCSKRDFERSEYYNDFLRRLNIAHGIGATFAQSASGAASHFTATRSRRTGPFGDDEIKLIELLLPHFKRSLQLHERMIDLAQEGQEARKVLDRIPYGCVLIGPAGRVLYLNPAAERILGRRDGLTITGGILTAQACGDSRALAKLLASVTATGLRQSLQPGSYISISRDLASRPYAVLILPITSPQLNEANRRVVGAVFINDPDADALNIEQCAGQLYSLTTAEARLVQALLKTGGLKQAAEFLSISINTAKTHLQHIFQKTNTRRQAELIRLVVGGPKSA